MTNFTHDKKGIGRQAIAQFNSESEIFLGTYLLE
jgi:hypothetical protein